MDKKIIGLAEENKIAELTECLTKVSDDEVITYSKMCFETVVNN